MKKYICLLLSLSVALAVSGCAKKEEKPSSRETSATSAVLETTVPDSASTDSSISLISPEASKLPSTTKGTTAKAEKPAQGSTAEAAKPATSAPEETVSMQKTGEMEYSADANNRYIKAVSKKYGVDSALLSVLYTVPENDSNMVLEFNGSVDGNGNIIRNKDTLVAIYTIDKQLNSKCASKDKSRNEYPFGEMTVMFITTTKYIMPEFPELS